jgi:hypothetical protein
VSVEAVGASADAGTLARPAHGEFEKGRPLVEAALEGVSKTITRDPLDQAHRE